MRAPVSVVTNSPQATEELGESWAQVLAPGWVVDLTGDLGAGKTQLVKGIARGLGVRELIHSPTFTLVNEYRNARIPFFHLDLYRLDTRAQIIAAGLEEYLFEPAGVAVVEWAERWFEMSSPNLLPPNHRRVVIETIGDTSRRITYEDTGA
jgi:tRNA threonylcarbamoyladenosine biosynthesis protein TsaE